jgi:adenylate cyclase
MAATRDESPITATILAAEAEGLSSAAIAERVWAAHGITCAMLALDSSGMTRASRRHGIVHFLHRYLKMRDVAAGVIEQHGCMSWRCFADNLFAEFPDADTALTVALEIHRRVREAGVMLTDTEPYRVCLGIGFGPVLRDGRFGVMGDEMNLVAKLAEDIAEGGDTLLTEAAYGTLKAHAAISAEKRTLEISKVNAVCYRVRQ